MNTPLELLKQEIQALNDRLLNHPLYGSVDSEIKLRLFMESHIYAVWDFMSLLKQLQLNLTCVSTPWVPVGNADTRFLINEIVLGEESDVDEDGIRTSHFELYLKAMKQVGANTQPINVLLDLIRQGNSVSDAMASASLPLYIKEFLNTTFSFVEANKVHEIAAVFTFGREDVIPQMFIRLVNDIEARVPGTISTFKYYLERHIEVDGDHHSHLALQMTELLCGTDEQKWKEAIDAAKKAIEARIGLWDGIYEIMIHMN